MALFNVVVDLRRGLYRKIYGDLIHDRRLNSLPLFVEVVYYRLHLVADDFGRFRADAVLLKSEAFPRREDVTAEQITEALGRLQTASLLRLYEIEGESYGELADYLERQPCGRNGCRVMRFPPPAGESEESPGNPGESGGVPVNPVGGMSMSTSSSRSSSNQQDHHQEEGQTGRNATGGGAANKGVEPKPPVVVELSRAAITEAFSRWAKRPLTARDLEIIRAVPDSLPGQKIPGSEVRPVQLVPHAIASLRKSGLQFDTKLSAVEAVRHVEATLKSWVSDPSQAAAFVKL